MGLLIIFVPIFAGIAFHGVFGLGLMEILLLDAALVGLPLLAEKFLISKEADAFFERTGPKWFWWIAYFGIAVVIYYASTPTIDRYLPLGTDVGQSSSTDYMGVFLSASAVGLLVALPIHTLCILILDWLGVWKSALARINGETHGPARSGPSKPSVVRDKLIAFGCGFAVFFVLALVFQASNVSLQAAVMTGGAVGLLLDFILRRRREAAARKPAQEHRSAPDDDDRDFSFNQDRWEKASSWSDAGGTSGYNAEADYQNALTEAQKWADQASSLENAMSWAGKFEKLCDNPALHPKDKLRYRLAAMLLRERLKGQGKASSPGAGRDPTDADLSRLGLPVPPR